MQLTWDKQAWNIDLFAYNILQVYIESYRHMTYVSITTQNPVILPQDPKTDSQPTNRFLSVTHESVVRKGSDSNTTDGIVDGHAYTVITCLNDVAGTEHPGSKDTSLEKIFWWSGALGVKRGKTAGSCNGCQPRNEMIRTWAKDFRKFFCFEGCSMLAHHCIRGVIWFLEPNFPISKILKANIWVAKIRNFHKFCINA